MDTSEQAILESFAMLLAPVKNLIGVAGMPPRHACYRRPGF